MGQLYSIFLVSDVTLSVDSMCSRLFVAISYITVDELSVCIQWIIVFLLDYTLYSYCIPILLIGC